MTSGDEDITRHQDGFLSSDGPQNVVYMDDHREQVALRKAAAGPRLPGMSQAAATPTPPPAEEPLADLVVRLVSEGAAKIDGVDAAYVSRDGSEFVLTGSDRSTQMYRRCAEFAVQLCDQVDQILGRTVPIMGGWTRDSRPVQGWTVAYSR